MYAVIAAADDVAAASARATASARFYLQIFQMFLGCLPSFFLHSESVVLDFGQTPAQHAQCNLTPAAKVQVFIFSWAMLPLAAAAAAAPPPATAVGGGGQRLRSALTSAAAAHIHCWMCCTGSAIV